MGGNYDRLGRTIDAPSLWESSTIQLDAEQTKMRNMTYNFSHTHYRANVLRKSWCSSKDTARDLEVECRDASPAHALWREKQRGCSPSVSRGLGVPGTPFLGNLPRGHRPEGFNVVPLVAIFGGLSGS